MTMDTLRDYQQEMLDRLDKAWGSHRSVMVQMPTGTGKTVLLAEVIRKELRGAVPRAGMTNDGVLVVAHRIELIEQISQTLDRFGIEHGLIVSGKPVDETKSVQVASIQTLARRGGPTLSPSPGGGERPALVVIDEAHHALAKTYRMLWEWWPEARFLGLTATPCRLSNAPFTDLFQTLLQSRTIQEFIRAGWLSDFDYVTAEPDNPIVQQVAGLTKRGADGDYQTKEMALVMDCEESTAQLYRAYRKFADGKKGIVYAINREHARHVAEYYRAGGVSCCWIEAKTPAAERERMVQDYREGRTDVVVNVDIFSEGFDIPEVEFIQLARPTLSLSKYLQQVGRGMRISKGKASVTILDHVGMYQAFGLPTEDWDWQLMFAGRQAGKAGMGRQPLFIRDWDKERELADVKMVHVKRRGEEHEGMEVFMKDGRYGVMKDGRVVCAPEIEHVRRLDAPYFCLAVYPFPIWKSRADVIDMDGRVLRPGFYGDVRQEGDVFIGTDMQGVQSFWDARGGRHYRQMPVFGRIGSFGIAKIGNMVYMRQSSRQWDRPVRANGIYRNRSFVIFDDVLVFTNDPDREPFQVCGYDKYYVYIRKRQWISRTKNYAKINEYGDIDSYVSELPPALSSTPVNMGNLKLSTAEV